MPGSTSVRIVLLAVLCGGATAPAGAQQTERIAAFHADILVRSDAALEVVETIEVYAAGNAIKRGIYREIPHHGLEPGQVLIDGRSSPYHTEPYGRGTRVYIGDRDVQLAPGTYTYTLAYRIPLEVRFFDDYDEVYWNVTGVEWAFPIEKATARVRLPRPVDESDLRLAGWTGPERSTATHFVAEKAPGTAFFETTAPLDPGEGLTIRLTFPKGVVQPPTRMQIAGTLLRQLGFSGTEAGAIGFIAFYLVVAWAMFGKDPAPGRVLPADQPPHGFSPAACRFIRRMGYDPKAFTIALISMATKGYLRIEQDADGKFVVVRDTAGDAVLSPDERALARELFKNMSEVRFTRTNRSTISAAVEAFRKALARHNEKEYFKTNSIVLVPSVVVTIVALVVLGLSGTVREPGPAAFLCLWLTIWTMVVAFLGANAVGSWAAAVRAPSASTIRPAIGATLFFAAFGIFEIFALWALASVASVGFAATVIAAAVLHAVFYNLMKAPTSMGRRFLDELDGFEMYLEGENLTRFGDQNRAERFERYLPYAVALGKEVEWTRKFEAAAEHATAASGRTYAPAWYPTSRGTTDATTLVTGLGASLGAAISTATASSSSGSGGGGGSSGGGGGGGGGGGW